MNSIFNSSLVQIGLSMMANLDTERKEWKDRILKEWDNSKNYPRKKKKKTRKYLEIEWRIACYNPLNF